MAVEVAAAATMAEAFEAEAEEATAESGPAELLPLLAEISLADASFDTGRPVPESTLGGETTCIICFTNPKSHVAVPCGHLCACGPCSDRMSACPYCREPVTLWVLTRPV